MSALGYVIVAFAAYRMARAISLDDISLPLRERLYAFAYDDEHSEVQGTGKDAVLVPAVRAPWRTWLYKLFDCPLCIGFWISAALYSLWRWWDTDAVRAVIAIFAVAGAQCFLQMREDDDA